LGTDFSKSVLRDVTVNDLDELTAEQAANHRETAFPTKAWLGHHPIDHMTETELLRPGGDSVSTVDSAMTISALLLFGKEEAIKRAMPV
jgi:hypothetical protein